MSENYPAKPDWDEFFNTRYSELLSLARRHSRDPHDLLHHCYIRCLNQEYPSNPMGYAAVTLFREATRGQFKRIYKIHDGSPSDLIAADSDLTASIQREQMQLIIDRLSWFDRTIMNLYLEGWSMVEVANATDIAVGTLYQCLHRSRKTIIDALRNG